MLKNIVKDRLILSPINDAWTPEPLEGGSLYNDLCNKVRRNIENGDDWLWLHNRINGDKMMASEFESLSKKFAVFYSNLGLVAGTVLSSTPFVIFYVNIKECHKWVMSSKPLEALVLITELPWLVEKKSKQTD